MEGTSDENIQWISLSPRDVDPTSFFEPYGEDLSWLDVGTLFYTPQDLEWGLEGVDTVPLSIPFQGENSDVTPSKIPKRRENMGSLNGT
jgi:hypothetical protein